MSIKDVLDKLNNHEMINVSNVAFGVADKATIYAVRQSYRKHKNSLFVVIDEPKIVRDALGYVLTPDPDSILKFGTITPGCMDLVNHGIHLLQVTKFKNSYVYNEGTTNVQEHNPLYMTPKQFKKEMNYLHEHIGCSTEMPVIVKSPHMHYRRPYRLSKLMSWFFGQVGLEYKDALCNAVYFSQFRLSKNNHDYYIRRHSMFKPILFHMKRDMVDKRLWKHLKQLPGYITLAVRWMMVIFGHPAVIGSVNRLNHLPRIKVYSGIVHPQAKQNSLFSGAPVKHAHGKKAVINDNEFIQQLAAMSVNGVGIEPNHKDIVGVPRYIDCGFKRSKYQKSDNCFGADRKGEIFPNAVAEDDLSRTDDYMRRFHLSYSLDGAVDWVKQKAAKDNTTYEYNAFPLNDDFCLVNCFKIDLNHSFYGFVPMAYLARYPNGFQVKLLTNRHMKFYGADVNTPIPVSGFSLHDDHYITISIKNPKLGVVAQDDLNHTIRASWLKNPAFRKHIQNI